MSPEAIDRLVSDAEAVAAVGTNLGRFKDPDQLLNAIVAVQQAQAGGTVPPTLVAALQKAMNQAVPDLSPITLHDLRSGWRPYGGGAMSGKRVSVFVSLCVVLLLLTGSFTLLYDRTIAHLNMMQELQSPKAQEAAIKLYSFIRANQEIIVNDKEGKMSASVREKMLELLSFMYQIDKKMRSYGPIKSYIESDVNPINGLKSYVMSIFTSTQGIFSNKNYDLIYKDDLKKHIGPYVGDLNWKSFEEEARNLGGQETLLRSASKCEVKSDQKNPQDVMAYCALAREMDDLDSVLEGLRVRYDPRDPTYFFVEIFTIQLEVIRLGNWVLPALYGTLGAVIFYLRRFLDPNFPNPSTASLVFRIVLGGFAGIVAVWLWSPANDNPAQVSYAAIPAFGLAFLVGFSTDVFFQLLDKAVFRVQEALGR